MALLQGRGMLAGVHSRNLTLGTECCGMFKLLVIQWPNCQLIIVPLGISRIVSRQEYVYINFLLKPVDGKYRGPDYVIM